MPATDQNVVASIIIPAWRLRTELRACLDALSRSEDAPAYEVIVVVNGANSEILEIVNQHPRVDQVIPLAENVGFGWACNVGARMARGQYLVFLNDDTEVFPNWLRNLVAAARQHSAGVVGSVLVDETDHILEAGTRMLRDGEVEFLGKGTALSEAAERQPELLQDRTVDYASGAALLFDAELFRQLGGFDPLFIPAYYEDTDLQFRVKANGRDIWVTPSARVLHRENGSTKGMEVFREFAVNNSKGYFLSRWGNALVRAVEQGAPISETLVLPPRSGLIGGLDQASSDPAVVTAAAAEIQRNYVSWLERRVTELQARCEWLDGQAAQIAAKAEELNQRLVAEAKEKDELLDGVQHWRSYGMDAWDQLQESEARVGENEQRLAESEQRLAESEQARVHIEEAAAALSAERAALLGSVSWRTTAPLRFVRNRIVRS